MKGDLKLFTPLLHHDDIDDDILRAATVAKASSIYAAVDYALSRSSSSSAIAVRDERYRASTANSSSLYPGGRL